MRGAAHPVGPPGAAQQLVLAAAQQLGVGRDILHIDGDMADAAEPFGQVRQGTADKAGQFGEMAIGVAKLVGDTAQRGDAMFQPEQQLAVIAAL